MKLSEIVCTHYRLHYDIVKSNDIGFTREGNSYIRKGDLVFIALNVGTTILRNKTNVIAHITNRKVKSCGRIYHTKEYFESFF